MKDVVVDKDLGYLQIDNSGLTPSIGLPSYNMGQWNESNDVFWMEQEIDIAGLTKQELTFFPLSGDVQRGPVSLGLTNGIITEWIYVTTSPHPIADDPTYNLWNLVGQGGSNTEFQNIIWGRAWTWVNNTSIPQNFGISVNTTSLGSGEPTNGDKLYVYRVVSMIGQTPGSGFAELGSVRIILAGQLREEAEYQQIMRLRRSYELQQSYDED